MRLFSPYRYVSSIDLVDIDDLVASGVRALLIDRDNTLVPRDAEHAPGAVVTWLEEARSRGIRLCMVSNNWHEGEVSRSAGELGEEAFRVLETGVLESLQGERSLLVGCGGGIIETPRNIELMHQMGYCVYLDGDIGDSLRQIRRSDTRPDFRSATHAAGLLEHRRPLYREAADITVDIRGKSFVEVSYNVAEMLLERGLL